MKHVGTTDEVIRAFIEGRSMHTAKAPVPGGYRVDSVPDVDNPGEYDLYSYRTIVAHRFADDCHGQARIALTTRKYSVTTSKLMGHVRAALVAEGYRPTGEVVMIEAAVPGRWGGFGLPWHATGRETIPFEVYA
jgi:hypothetical protein